MLPLDPLTERELEVLRLMAAGMSNPLIAEKLFIGVETVRWYAKEIYSKLGVHTRTEASMRARDLGLLENGTADTRSSSLQFVMRGFPIYTTPFVGREAEFAELNSLLREANMRLITLVGPGGVGKTRLCVELAREQALHLPDGVFFVPLLTVTSAHEFDRVIANRLNLHLRDDHAPRPQLLQYLETRRLMLVLDNFEQVPDGAELVAAVLEHSPGVKILITSQVSLNLSYEWVRSLDALDFPPEDSGSAPENYNAVRLFDHCARRVRGDFSLEENIDAVAHICRMVHGVPLAVELAAAFVKTLTCQDVANKIQGNIDFLASKHRDIEERHRSMQAVFEYGWNLLTAEEQQVFRRLSVFRGAFGAAAAEQVAGASVEILSELVGKSLLQQSGSEQYAVHALLRQYAERKLEALDLVNLSTRSSKVVAWSALVRGDFRKMRELAESILQATSDSGDATDKAFALAALGVLAGVEEDFERCRQLCEASQQNMKHDPITAVFLHFGLAASYSGSGNYTVARHHIRASLEQAVALKSPAFGVLCLPLASIMLAHEVEPERAVELLALTLTHPAAAQNWMDKWPLLVRLRQNLHDELGQSDFNAAWERGKALNLEQIFATLLKEL